MRSDIRPSRIRPLAALLGLAVVVAACSSTGGGAYSAPGTAASAAPAAAASAPAAAASAKASGGGKYGSSSSDGYGTPASAAPAASAASGGGEAYAVAVASGALGSYLTGENGLTLYTFKPDSANTSTCSGDCATNWPPFAVTVADTLKPDSGITGKLTTFARADGTMQVAYNGAPLYYFAGDSAAGDANGQGLANKWYVAAP